MASAPIRSSRPKNQPPSRGSTNVAPADSAAAGEVDLSIKRQVEALERDLITRALARTGGNRTRAAQLLQLSHRALLYKIRDYGLDGG